MATISWANAAGGDWSLGSNWSGSVAPSAIDDALIILTGSPYTVTINFAQSAMSLMLDSADATVDLNAALTLGAPLTLNAGTFNLNSLGKLAGATIIGSGMVFNGGTLSGVTRQDTLDLSASGAKATVTNGITLTDAGGTGPGLLTLYNALGSPIAQVTLDTPTTSPVFTLDNDSASGTLLGIAPSSTYRGTITTGIVLSIPTAQNPTTVTATGYITNNTANYNGDAVYGTSAAAWTLSNYGTINATAAYSHGIRLMAGGFVTNGLTGTVVGAAAGVEIENGAGTVTNLGTITATQADSTGIWLQLGGSVVNGSFSTPTALIAGDADGVVTGAYTSGAIIGADHGGLGTVTNYGTIIGPNVGVWLAQGGSLLNFGTILAFGAYGDGVAVWHAAGTVSNGVTGLIDANNLGVWLQAGGIVANSGVIRGVNAGVYIEGAAGTLISDGTVESTDGTGVVLMGGGLVRNNVGGVIEGYDGGVALFNAPGTVLNYALISGTGSSAYPAGVFLEMGGTVVNGAGGATTATIESEYNAVWSRDAAGTVTNYGTIVGLGPGGNGVFLYQGGIVTNGAPGYTAALISGPGTGVLIQNVAGTVVNYGTILGTSGGSVGVYLGALGIGPSVTNQEGAQIEGGAGIFIAGEGMVVNLGTITGTAASYGPGVFMAQGGTLTNGSPTVTDALIAGVHSAVTVYGGPGTIINYGTLTASVGYEPAADLRAGGSVTNFASGLIQGGGLGVMIAGAGTVNNFGTIEGVTESGVRMDDAGAAIYNGTSGAGIAAIIGGDLGVVLNEGGRVVNGYSGSTLALIQGGFYGVRASYGTATVTNYGTVAGTAAAGVFLDAGGDVHNEAGASITSLNLGIGIYNAVGMVDNFGSVLAGGVAVYLAAGGSVNNRYGATIEGGHGVALGGAGTVINSGTITGTIAYSGFGVILGAGGSIINGAYGATDAVIASTLRGAWVYGGAGTVANYGTIAVSITYASAVYLHAGGLVTNNPTGLIQGGGQGVVITGGVGTVDNFGTIVGIYGAGVVLGGGGAVNNGIGGATAASIVGEAGVELLGPGGTILNYATIAGTTYTGILATAGASIDNAGLVTGALYGAKLLGAATTVVNTGTIEATAISSTGLRLAAGGTIDNSGTIAGDANGAFIDVAALVVNNGLIVGGVAINTPTAATVTNYAVISSTAVAYGVGVYMGGAGGLVTNSGTIAAPDGVGVGVNLHGGGLLTNLGSEAIGTITGGHYGVYVGGAGGTVFNSGVIEGGDAGVVMRGAANVLLNYGLIAGTGVGATGVALYGSTLFNAGVISGDGFAVRFGYGDDRLILNPNGSFVGLVDGSDGSDVLQLVGLYGALGGFGTNFLDFEQIAVDADAYWQLTGTSPLVAGTTVINSGTLTFVGTLDNNGLFQIQADAVLVFEDVVTGGGGIDFIGAGGVLAVGGATMANTIFGFDPGDTIDLIGFAGGTSATLGVNNLLTVSNGGSTYTLQLDPLQDFSGALFSVSDDGSGGTNVAIGSLVVSSGQTFFVSSGQSFTGINVLNGGTLVVLSGGTTVSAVDSGTEIVSGGGLDVGATIGNLGAQNVFGTASATTVASGGAQNVELGGVVFGATVQLGGIQTVAAGGLVSGVVLEAGSGAAVGGIQLLSGTASGTTIQFQAVARVVQSGLDIGATVNSGGLHSVESGGTAVGATVLGGGAQTVEGTASATHVGEGGLQIVGPGGTAIGTVVDAVTGGGESASGGTVEGAAVGDGTLIVLSGGTALGATISGTEILSGGTDISGTVESGGVLVVSAGGLASGALVHSGGLVVVSAGGVTSGVTLAGVGPIVSGLVGAQETVSAGGLATSTTVSSGGRQVLLSGGTASGTLVHSGGIEAISAGGVAVGTSLFGNSPVSSGSTAAQQNVSSGGTALATNVFSGGRLLVLDGGATFGAVVFDGGVEVVSSGGASSAATISSGGRQVVSAGGAALGTIVLNGGTQFLSGGTVSASAVFAGGILNVSAGGIANGTTISGGIEVVFAGGLAFDAMILAGGIEVVSAGGVTSDATLVGATLQLADGGSASGTIFLDGVGDLLRIDGATMPLAVIAGFDGDDRIDLRGMAFVGGGSATLGAGNLLTVHQGGATFDLQLDPSDDFNGLDFAVFADGFGGTGVQLALVSTGPSLINGLGGAEGFGENALPPNDDGFTDAIDITAVFGSGLNFFGTVYDHLYINNNGNITFNAGLSDFTPGPITAGFGNPIIAAFWADVDTRGGAGLSTGGNATGSNTLYYDLDAVNHVLTVTWNDVGYYNSHNDKLNAFQIQLIDRGGGNFDIVFRYQAVYWTTGDASGGADGLGGTVARAGYSAGDDVHAFELPQSGDQNAMLGLPSTPAPDGTQGATDTAGIYLFEVRNGVIIPPRPTGLALDPSSDSGTVGDNTTNVKMPLITGNGVSGYSVTLFDGTTVVGTGTVASDGTWAITTTTLVSGVHDLTAMQTDLTGAVSAASDPLALTIIAGEPHIFQFLFTYGDGTDYYLGTAVDDGSFGYSVGQIIPSTLGRYDILSDLGATTLPVGTVSVNTYYHSGIGQASTTPVLTAAGLPSGTQGLGSESDALLGLDGQLHPFSDEMKATFEITTAFGFIYTYADGAAFYTGIVADDGRFGSTTGTRPVFDASGNFRGSYVIFNAGQIARASGTVIIDRFVSGNVSFTPNHAGLAAVDGTGGLGSEAGSIIVNGSTLFFSDVLEPLIALTFPTVPLTPPPSPTDIFIAEVNQVYADVLGRNPDPSGLATYTAALADGMSPTTIRQLLASSAEAQFLLNRLYQQVFDREIDPSGLANYSAFLANGSSLAAVQLIIAQSAEAQNSINEIYQEVLGRDADGSGMTTYMGALANLTDPFSLRDVRDTIAHSPEAVTDLMQLVSGTLGRSTFAAELAGMQDALTDGASQQTLQSQLIALGTAGSYGTVVSAFGNEVLTAPPATPTLFDFTDINFGQDTIVGFDPADDTIQLSNSLVADFATLQGHMLPFLGGTGINLDATHIIQVQGVAPEALGSANFRFV